jgi:phosphatidylglycerophosphate synthase
MNIQNSNLYNSPNKLPKKLDNPIDNWILDVCEKMDPFFVKCNMTPNKLTTISAYFGLLGVYCLHNKIKYLPGIFYFISYMFDGADGQYARRHNMVSKFGDYYDHFKDWTIMFMIFYVLYKRRKLKSGVIVFIIFILGLSGTHIGCQELYYKQNNPYKEHSETLSFCKYLCPFENELERAMNYTRYFGLGTSNLIISLFLFFV